MCLNTIMPTPEGLNSSRINDPTVLMIVTTEFRLHNIVSSRRTKSLFRP